MRIKHEIFSIAKKIPKGKVMTYGQIAKLLNIKDVRLIGWMLHQNKDQKIPCYRVVRSDGTCAKGYAFGGTKKQQKLLEKDGIGFKSNKIVTLSDFLFSP
jgi:methylated-DNA-protein-cysteine methyltransferase-like protein